MSQPTGSRLARPEDVRALPLTAATPDRHVEHVVASLLEPQPQAKDPLPARGLPLGLRLGLLLATTVVLVLGGVTALQQRREMAREWRDREALLAESLAPLAVEVESATTADEIRERLRSFQQAYLWRGYADHQVALLTGLEQVVASSVPGMTTVPETTLRAGVTVSSALLPGGTGRLEVWQDATLFRADVRERWRWWWFNIALTAVIIVATLQVAIFFLISRPLGLLVRSLRRMEMGYLGPVDVPRGAWEVRWLASHLERTAVELQQTVRRLVAAERRALRQPRPTADLSAVFVGDHGTPADPAAHRPPTSPRQELVRQYLEDTHRLLSSLDPADPLARSLARDAWERTAVEAEQAGAMDLKARLEDCALRIIEPGAYSELERRLAASTASRRGWFAEQHRRLERALSDAGVPHLGIQRRVKHLAGIWRKMQEKQLELEQVHDVYALRVIVPDEERCYLALHAVHGAFEPEPFRFKDYIANPKSNGYRSLHTTVRDERGHPLEIQIRSLAMHQAAERGSAAHWRYKAEGLDVSPSPGRLRQLVRRFRPQVAAS